MKKNKSLVYAFNMYGAKSLFINITSIIISNIAVVSFQKSGRTWLRVMFGRILAEKYGLSKTKLDMERVTFGRKLPNVLFSHGGCTKNHNRLDFRRIFRRKRSYAFCKKRCKTMDVHT